MYHRQDITALFRSAVFEKVKSLYSMNFRVQFAFILTWDTRFFKINLIMDDLLVWLINVVSVYSHGVVS